MQKKEQQLIKNTAIIAVGKICTQFVSFFLLPLYTALLSTEDYGTVDILNTYIGLLIPIFFFQSDQAIFRFLIDVRNDIEGQKKYITNCLASTGLQVAVFIVFYVIVNPFLHESYKIFLATNVVFSMASNLILQISRGQGDNLSYSIGSLISGAGTVIFNVFFIAVMKMGAIGLLLATLIGNVLCILYISFRIKLPSKIDIRLLNKDVVKTLWKYSLPLVPNQLSWWIVNTSDRVIINWIIGVGANGIYSVANKFPGVCITFFNIFNLSWAESTSVHINEKDKGEFFSKVFNSTLKLFIALTLGVISFMPFFFKLLITGEGYADAYYQIPILMISTIFNIVVALLGSIYVALKKTKEIAKTSIFAAVINILVNVILIKHIGLYAASISTVISYLAMSVYRYIDVQRYVEVRIEWKMVVVSTLFIFIVVSIYYYRNLYLCVIGALLSVVYALVYNQALIKSGFEMIKKKIIG
jgi:O-antigen/teichoic acid export membrane protein